MEKRLTVGKKEERRANVLAALDVKQWMMGEACTLLGLSERQVWRLLAQYRMQGLAGLVHGNRGRTPIHATPEEVREQVVRLARGAYDGANYTHMAELLAERDGVTLSRWSVRRILKEAGITSPKQHRAPRHRSRRQRYAQEGMLLQVDGSPHLWLEERGPELTLAGAIDDATGKVVGAVFREQEDTHGYFLVMQQVLESKGIPLAVYSDRHSIFQRSPKDPETLEEQLAGERRLTQLGEALRTLGVQLKLAQSPQAKGRIERLWGTLQDRLVIELRLAGAKSIDEANRFLKGYLQRYNAEFSVPPAQEGPAYRPVDPAMDLAGVLCFKYYRTAAADNTVTLDGETYQLLPGPEGRSYARRRVEIQERLDGSVVICWQGQRVGFRAAPAAPVTLRARRSRGAAATPAGPKVGLGGRMSPAGAAQPTVRSKEGRAQGKGGAAVGPANEDRHVPVAKSQAQKPRPDHPWRKRWH